MKISTVYFTGFMILIMALTGCSSKASTTTIASQNSNKLNESLDEFTTDTSDIVVDESIIAESDVPVDEPIIEIESQNTKEESIVNSENEILGDNTAETFESSATLKVLPGFLDFRKTNFTVTIPDNKESLIIPGMTEGSVSFSDRDKEIPSCDATILYETATKSIHQITVISPDDATLDSGKFKELISTIIVQMGISDMEEASKMVESAYDSEEPMVANNTYLHLNRNGQGFMIKY